MEGIKTGVGLMISSSSNAQIKYLVKLQEKSAARKADGVFVCEGRKMFQEVLKYAKETLVRAYFSESHFKELWEEGTFPQGLDYEVVTDAVFREAAQTVTPQGVLALVRQPAYMLADMLGMGNKRLLILENLRDPGNLGTILRTAEAAGMDGVVLSLESVDVFNPKVIRSTMGAIYRMPFLYVPDLEELLRELKQEGFVLYAAHLEGSKAYDAVKYAGRMALVVGNEANGLTRETADMADYRIRIPMEGQAESLNAAVAAAVLMYEAYRQGRAEMEKNSI